ncbi:MAG: carbon starvation protein A [Deltaproteobacteria bacterium]|jgi:carbon starvation protein CstA|nr:carbon starvation protein A [Deltaproteobacteria bacterium]
MPPLFYFFLALACLLVGYFVYSKIVEKLFIPNYDRPTPAVTMNDGVDYLKLPTWKVFLIQLLNIAGVGPVFGPILGALYGPAALFWIVIGSLVAGAVHDYFSGMMSLRYAGQSIPDVIGFTLGNGFKQFMRLFSLVLLVLVGVVFVTAPATMLAGLTPDWMDMRFWIAVIFIYYFAATILPIDVIIAKIYPLFALVLIIMAVGVSAGLIFKGYAFYNWSEIGTEGIFANLHPDRLPMWPLMFITIACGALSGFHATQSPLMSRCLINERSGRSVFYGAMIAESVIALIWATAAMTYFGSPVELAEALKGTPSAVVNTVSLGLLGTVGGILAILGVVVLPITSGDTAFRAARLIVGDVTRLPQKKIGNRLLIAMPIFIVGIVICQIDFEVIWRYFGWSNQTLATVVLWAAAAYVVRRGTNHWFVTVPATFMTATCISYICVESKLGFGMSFEVSATIGVISALAALVWFLASLKKFRDKIELEIPISFAAPATVGSVGSGGVDLGKGA